MGSSTTMATAGQSTPRVAAPLSYAAACGVQSSRPLLGLTRIPRGTPRRISQVPDPSRSAAQAHTAWMALRGVLQFGQPQSCQLHASL